MKIKNKKMNKRGQIFTIISILLISLMFVSFELFSFIHERNVVKTRVSTMNNFLYSIEQNLERQMYISGFRILFLAENEITSTGEYIDVEDFFNAAFFNGTVNGDSNNSILVGATYDDIIFSLNEKSKKINVDIVLTNSSISITQEDPWFVKFTMTSDFIMQDKGDLAKWNKQQVISAFIPVEGFEDPIYTVNSYARVSRKISQTLYEGNYATDSDITNLLSHFDNNYYAANPSAPNFLKRLEGNLSANENGIESFVDTSEFSQQGISILTKSDIDYIYFSSNNPTYYSVSGMPSWFNIDSEDDHLTKYNVTELIS